MTVKEKLAAHRQEILRLAARHGAKNLRIFGSIARGEERADSDVDFLVELEPGKTLFDLGGLQADLEETLGCHVDIVTEKGLRSRIHERVLREAVGF